MATPLDLQEQEQLDDLKAFWRRHGNLITWTLVLALSGYALWNGWTWYQRDQGYRAGAIFDELERSLGAEELDRAGRIFTDLREKYPSTVWAANGPDRLKSTIEPSSLGLAPATVTDLEGGDAITNAAILTGILDGSVTGPKRDLVTLNAAAGLVITGIADDLSDGLHLANEAIASGAARAVLERWRNFV